MLDSAREAAAKRRNAIIQLQQLRARYTKDANTLDRLLRRYATGKMTVTELWERLNVLSAAMQSTP